MKLPIKPSLLTIRRGKPQWIILHHTSELYVNPAAKIDNPKFQLKALSKGVLDLKQADVNYHYVIDKIEEDYQPIICRPFVYLCDWDDIAPSINNRAIHVALLGNYDFKIPEKRLYEILSYKILNPMLKMFALTQGRIKLHRDVSSNKELTCPGDFIDEAMIEATVRRFLVK
jgi:hypothetical protein